MKDRRASGVLCHISSLASPYGIGDMGPEAYRFVDWLKKSGQRYWQVLPLNPTDNALGHSPYSSYSAFGFNGLLISPEMLYKEGLLTRAGLDACIIPSDGVVALDHVFSRKAQMLEAAYATYKARWFKSREFESFCGFHKRWLDDHALFVVLKSCFDGHCWTDWPVPLRERHPQALKDAVIHLEDKLLREKFSQYIFYRQWGALQNYCSRRGVGIIGDMPIYVNYDSVDVWRDPSLFKLDGNNRQTFVAGVPPDYFSKEGQRWGNPVYDWENLKATGFDWWVERMRHNLQLFDLIRIDHFRAFVQCWEIPASEPTAVRGAWRDVPGVDLFSAFQKAFHQLPIIAEDLGIITPDVDALKERFTLPGMRVLMFAFHNDYKKSRDLPENHVPLSVVYTGTHDNNTVCGWYGHDATAIEKKNMLEYFGRIIPQNEVNWVMIGMALRSVSNLAVIPVQDILGLGQEARMNTPSTVQGNWKWRLLPGALTRTCAVRLAGLTKEARR